MGIAHRRHRSVPHRNAGEFARRQHAALDMNMCIDKSRHNEPIVNRRIGREFFDADNARAGDGHLPGIDAPRVQIDE